MIVGADGVGKAWAARVFANVLDDVPPIHKDALALRTGWQQRDRAEHPPGMRQLRFFWRAVMRGDDFVAAIKGVLLEPT